MEKLTISAVEPKGTWDSQYGTMHESWVTLSDGREGSVNSKAADTWKVGDAVEVKEATPGKYGTKFKLGKWQSPGGSGGFKSDPETSMRIDASWAIGQAVAMNKCETAEMLVRTSLWLLECRDFIIAEVKKKKDGQEHA
jgi:hypothetical protein